MSKISFLTREEQLELESQDFKKFRDDIKEICLPYSDLYRFDQVIAKLILLIVDYENPTKEDLLELMNGAKSFSVMKMLLYNCKLALETIEMKVER